MHRSLLALAAALVVMSSPLVAQSGGPRPQGGGGRAAKPPVTATTMSTDVVNLNSASAAQIASLPGIGPKTAQLVVQYRTKNGPFKKIEEIMNVRGIGEKSFLRIKDRLTVADAKK
ncbi:MAG TPA: helix-hairpin-helix domain-containing protein [Vicinamibacterales bacterium]|nr:helix-hairpin-helix domain-containing protein [Vicinamibacterales bacterium]